MKVQATLNNYRRSSKKVTDVARVLRGMDCLEALPQLEMIDKKDADIFIKLISSAVANAENNFGLDKKNLFISEVMIGAGPTMKRWRARAYGRAASILKRTCKLTVVLDERKPTEGKAKPVKKSGKAEETKPEEGKVKKESAIKKQEDKTFGKDNKVTAKGKGFGKKVFRRKSA